MYAGPAAAGNGAGKKDAQKSKFSSHIGEMGKLVAHFWDFADETEIWSYATADIIMTAW